MQSVEVIAGLILAAGESSRMGRDKSLLTYRGRTFLEHIIDTLRQAGIERPIVVLGHHAAEIQRAADLRGAEVLLNPRYHRGQTSSLQRGLRALEGRDVEAVMLCLVDHPAATPETVCSLIAAFRESRDAVVIPTYYDGRGHPTIIARALFAEILALSQDEGANMVVRRYRDATCEVEVNDPGILIDVDDPEAYRRLRSTPGSP
ncbi:MAG TPA: nucleotidyltransferase family protein [Terriglobia bacterium]|nr:nucleotidyltransferase family protein [Terriglobia bacterium]